MANSSDYTIHTDVRFSALEHIDVAGLAAACQDDWFNQTLTRVNDCVVRLGVVRGEFHWHQHELEDEFFYVVGGRLLVDFRDSDGEHTVELDPQQGITVPRGVEHRTRAPEGAVMLMVEGAGVVPTGDAG